MADIVDVTNDREEVNLANALRASRKPEAPPANGYCVWCEQEIGDTTRRFCDSDCRDAYDRDQQRRGGR